MLQLVAGMSFGFMVVKAPRAIPLSSGTKLLVGQEFERDAVVESGCATARSTTTRRTQRGAPKALLRHTCFTAVQFRLVCFHIV